MTPNVGAMPRLPMSSRRPERTRVSEQVLVAGIGNMFLGDDGFGPEVIRHLQAAGQPVLPPDVHLVDYGIRGLHLCYDLLDGYAALILIDALPTAGRPGEVTVLAVDAEDFAAADAGYDPHGMNPVAVLAGLPALGGTLPPTYVIGAQPMDLGQGIGLSEPLRRAVPVAADAVQELLAQRPWAAEGADHQAAASGKG
jgi:hydrogenase maturation protease